MLHVKDAAALVELSKLCKEEDLNVFKSCKDGESFLIKLLTFFNLPHNVLNAYQEKARSFAVYPDNIKLLYPVIGLAGESGEVCEKFKKIYRDSEGVISNENKRLIALELGDVLWYVSNIAVDLGLELSEIARLNIQKLESRKKRNKLQGSGDER